MVTVSTPHSSFKTDLFQMIKRPGDLCKGASLSEMGRCPIGEASQGRRSARDAREAGELDLSLQHFGTHTQLTKKKK